MKVKGKVKPLRDLVFIKSMDFESQVTINGIFIPKDDGKVTGIRPRWGQVWAVGPDQTRLLMTKDDFSICLSK